MTKNYSPWAGLYLLSLHIWCGKNDGLAGNMARLKYMLALLYYTVDI